MNSIAYILALVGLALAVLLILDAFAFKIPGVRGSRVKISAAIGFLWVGALLLIHEATAPKGDKDVGPKLDTFDDTSHRVTDGQADDTDGKIAISDDAINDLNVDSDSRAQRLEKLRQELDTL